MARPRAASGGGRRLGVESAPPPQLEHEPEELEHDEPTVEPAPEAPELVAVLVEWEAETVGLLLSVVLLAFHWTLGRNGPPDAFVPDDAELRGMARPACRMLNRSERARRLATHGDGIAFATAFGGFVAKETRAVAEYQDAAPTEQPDVELADVGAVREAGAERVQGPVRRWRPPAVDEPPPA